MDVAVGDEPAADAVGQVGHARDPAVELDQPRVVLEIELRPLVPELGLGPVRVAVDGDIRRLEDGEHLVEPLRCGPCHAHGRHARRAPSVRRCGQPNRRPIPYRDRVDSPSIRVLTPDDWPDVARIYADGLATGTASFETHVPTWDEWDARHRREPRFVAEVDGAVAGWLAIMSTSPRHCYRGVVEHSVYVDAEARGRGVGRALLEQLVEDAPTHGIWTIQTSIMAANGASLALHTSVGFRTVGRRERIAERDGRWQDAMLLELRLP
jgi:L-amino acid N-acyltransferase YncA